MAGALTVATAADAPPQPLRPVVEVEEDVYSYEPANNGAGPMWCHGSTCMVREGDTVYASGLETLKAAKPLNNCRWTLWRRGATGWALAHADVSGRTREPCPLVLLPRGRLVLSANPTLMPADASGGGPARPELLLFQAANAALPPRVILPEWEGKPEFTEHSYRSFAAAGLADEFVLFQNIGYTHAEWTLGWGVQPEWPARGQLKWPWGGEYDTPQPIRICYPNVAIRKRAVHFCGVSDIVEPYEKWRAYKKQLTGREWDYDFRRLFYVWTPDLVKQRFGEWVEIASRDQTCGWIMPGDLWVAPDGAAHLVWSERALDERLRERFFPAEKQTHTVNYAVVREGKVVQRLTVAAAAEGKSNEIPSAPRFHVTPEDRLLVVYYVSGSDREGRGLSENRVAEVLRDQMGPAVRVPLQHPLSSYFTATVRGGSAPSMVLDLLGTRAGSGTTISYARVRLF